MADDHAGSQAPAGSSGHAGHVPVLMDAVLTHLDARLGETVLDATVGLGGHAKVLADAIGSDGILIGLDVDPANLAASRKTLADAPCRVELVQENFARAKEALASVGISGVDVILADLGLSSSQLDDGARGFSIQHDGPLDMRLDPRLKKTAADLVNRLKDRPLGDLIYENAQELAARKIARRICEVRRDKRITTTGELANLITKVVRSHPDSKYTKIHPATRTFQALRMAVNDEIGSLASFLEVAPKLLKPGGRIGIIAFHSLEDRPVKVDFRERKKQGLYRVITKKPIIADGAERRANPRSRSAKLRVAMRLPAEEMSDTKSGLRGAE